MQRLTDDQRIGVFELMLEEERAPGSGDRRDNARYLALKQTIAGIKGGHPDKALEAEKQLGGAVAALERSKAETGEWSLHMLQDLALKTRAYWPMMREALLKWGFRCRAQEGGASVGACSWPTCVCDPYAEQVLRRAPSGYTSDSGEQQ